MIYKVCKVTKQKIGYIFVGYKSFENRVLTRRIKTGSILRE